MHKIHTWVQNSLNVQEMEWACGVCQRCIGMLLLPSQTYFWIFKDGMGWLMSASSDHLKSKNSDVLCFVWYFYQSTMYNKINLNDFFDQGALDGKSEVQMERHLPDFLAHRSVCMHGGLIYVTYSPSVCLFICDWTKIQTGQKSLDQNSYWTKTLEWNEEVMSLVGVLSSTSSCIFLYVPTNFTAIWLHL